MALSGGEYERIFRISVTVVHQEHGPHYFSDTMTIHAKSYDVAVRQALGIAISHYSPEIREKVTVVETRGELYGTVFVPDHVQDRDAFIIQALAEAKAHRDINGG